MAEDDGDAGRGRLAAEQPAPAARRAARRGLRVDLVDLVVQLGAVVGVALPGVPRSEPYGPVGVQREPRLPAHAAADGQPLDRDARRHQPSGDHGQSGAGAPGAPRRRSRR